MHIVNNIDTVNNVGFPRLCSKGNVKHRTLLSAVDCITSKHRINFCRYTTCFGKREKKCDGLVGNSLFRIIPEETAFFECKTFSSRCIVSK